MNLAQINSSISVDCVVFGFDGQALKVLLVRRNEEQDFKLPGSMILEDETLSVSAYRVLEEMTGMRNIYLKQLHVFSEPDRVTGEDLRWINKYYGLNTTRVITTAYYSLIKLSPKTEQHTRRKHAQWSDVQEIKHLGLDHKKILMRGLDTLRKEMESLHVAQELLPRKFTVRQLQSLYEAVYGVEFDSRNFRKKILASGYLLPTAEREIGVAHKPAQYFVFNKAKYEKVQKRGFKFNF